MSDYARNYNFTTKDGLTTGDPAKVIKGSEVDAEFNDVLTAVNSKVDDPASPVDRDTLVYSSGAWVADSQALLPVGTVIPYAGATIPDASWLDCRGQSVSTTTYAALFAVIDYTYGGSGGSFNIPDLRGRAIFGQDDMGGTSANRLTGTISGLNGDILGNSGGVEHHVLDVDEMPAHTHDHSGSRVLDETSSAGTGTFGHNTSGDSATDSAGLSAAHTNMPPAFILNFLIKAT